MSSDRRNFMGKFYVGLDVGTDSVGIACTDENYNLLRAKGKDLWAVRLFDEAVTAADRRTKRTARRRLQRRAQRIDLLQELFEPYVPDKLFFARLNNSGFLYEDKNERLQSPYSLFADKTFTDKEYYKKFPTIFHLRRSLIDPDEKQDIRLYYLALHHIIKYRGHFLFEGQSMADIHDIKKLFAELNAIAENIFDSQIPCFDKSKAESLKSIFMDSGKRLNDKKKACFELFGAGPRDKEIITMILGGKGRTAIIFDNEEYNEEKSYSFADFDEETFAAKQEVFGDDFEYLQAMKNIYDYLIFERILSGNSYISDSMIKLYETHKSDLHLLKKFILDNFGHDEYVRFFKSTEEKCNYVNYIGYTKKGKRKVNVKKCTQDDFYKYLKGFIAKCPKGTTDLSDGAYAIKDDIIARTDDKAFLPKILNADNGLFPYQINGSELDAILKSLCRDYPVFAEKDPDGLSIADKIAKIFRFRIPYYVGPLNTAHESVGGNSWAVRKIGEEDGRITPWNFDSKIDRTASNEKFMRRMTNKCSYLHSENVLPRCSIIFQKFNTLNQLNKLKINEKPITVQLKQDIYNDLFLKYKRVSDRLIKHYLVNKGYVAASDEAQISLSGKDGDFSASMSSYIVLKKILGDFVDKNDSICENIILWHTLNTDKSVVEKLIEDHYGDVPEIKQNIKQLKGITSFKDFSTLSKKFLCGLYGGVDVATGLVYTILGELYRTNKNLNEILYDDVYSFNEAIKNENGDDSDEVTYDTLCRMYISPQTRRGVWQALRMTDEYITALGKAPDKIFVEVTRRSEKEKERTVSRRKKLLDLYNGIKDANTINELTAELNRKSDSDLRQERLYLYFMQCGKCAYTEKRINLEELGSDLYDVDHILPQSLVKDDSIDNKVLVLRERNKVKSDTYPLPPDFKRIDFWKKLKTAGLMSEKKYSLLTRTDPLNDSDYEDFINRQIVVTGQTAKAVAELLNLKYGKLGTEIVYSKAQNVTDFKNKFSIIKCRETNDLHHARDAYLNIVVGNVYNTRFTKSGDYYKKIDKEKADDLRKNHLKKLFYVPLAGAWEPQTSIGIVKSTLAKNSMTVTRYAFVGKGAFYDETVYGKGDAAIACPRKNAYPYNQTEKYGGYKSLKTAYFAIVESLDKKGRTLKTIEAIPVIVDYDARVHSDAVEKYLTEKVGLKQPKITVKKLKIKSLLEVNGTPVWIAGVTGKQIILHNAVQWYTDTETDEYVNRLVKLIGQKKDGILSEDKLSLPEHIVSPNRFGERKSVVNAEKNMALYDKIIGQLNKSIYKGVTGMSNVCEMLIKHTDKFKALSVFEQSTILLNCVKLLKCNAVSADLSLLGEGKSCGILLIGKNITNVDINIVHTSECGLTVYRRRL